MAESKSVLAHLMPSFYQPIEDRGTDALAYILNRSANCRGALDGLLRDGDVRLNPITRVETQVIDDPRSRPDMVGFDGESARRLMVEVKFWAILQPRQAWRYYQKLEKSGPGVLLFICPKSAVKYYWPQVCDQLEKDEEKPVPLERCETFDGTRRAHVVGANRHVLMVSWELLLDRLAAVALDFEVRSDIHQLQGLVQRLNDEAFPPLTDKSASDFAARDADLRKMVRDAVGRGKEEGWLNLDGLAFGDTEWYYRRFFSVVGVTNPPWLAVGIEYQQDLYERTPLWVSIWRKHSPGIKLPGDAVTGTEIHWLPIELKTGAVYDDVLDDVVTQLQKIADAFK